MSLADSLKDLYNSNQYPLHMPGHKRKDMGELSNAYHLDITEIEGYDNLYDAQGILKEAMDFASEMYRCPHTYFLVNGATTGIITAIYAATKQRDRIVIAANCHRSVMAAVRLRELEVDIIKPHIITEEVDGAVDCNDLEKLFYKKKKAGILPKALVITSPNYDGVVSDVKRIAGICHKYGVILIVDEAHGAHFSMDNRVPKGAINCGADIVIHSTHKTLAAMTQTALLHAQGKLVNITKVEEYWRTFQTSSPSYVLMASIDSAIRELDTEGKRLWDNFFEYKGEFLKKCEGLKALRLLSEKEVIEEGFGIALDPCKITVITGKGVSGYALQSILLKDYHIQPELASDSRILAIVTYSDSKEGFARFADALIDIDRRIIDGERFDHEILQAEAVAGENKDLYAPCIPGIR